MTLTEFLRARLDEDQAAAEAWSTPFSNPTAEQREHIARHDPARVLAEVDAKRRIIVECESLIDDPAVRAMETALCLLALPYADHPDYDQTWKP
jgi:hypothetical protein